MTRPSARLRAGVIAAGWGERLRGGREGLKLLKPLTPVAGLTLVERVLHSIAEAKPADVVVIINEASSEVREHVSARPWPFTIRWIVESTPSSMHSFLRVIEALAAGAAPATGQTDSSSAGNDRFLISTVDTVAPPGAFATFVNACAARDTAGADLVLAVTGAGDDEKPLRVRLDARSARVLGIGDGAVGSPIATAGYYMVRPSILDEAEAARRDGLAALRQFLGRLLDRGFNLAAVPVAEGVDVDRPSDITAAERFLRQVGA